MNAKRQKEVQNPAADNGQLQQGAVPAYSEHFKWSLVHKVGWESNRYLTKP
jgi:hypothetical protein